MAASGGVAATRRSADTPGGYPTCKVPTADGATVTVSLPALLEGFRPSILIFRGLLPTIRQSWSLNWWRLQAAVRTPLTRSDMCLREQTRTAAPRLGPRLAFVRQSSVPLGQALLQRACGQLRGLHQARRPSTADVVQVDHSRRSRNLKAGLTLTSPQ